MDLGQAISITTKEITKLKTMKNIEIEGRLGFRLKGIEGKFDSNISKTFYERIKKGLETKKDWKLIKEGMETDYFYRDMRLTVKEDGSQRCIKKKKLCIMDFHINNNPLDFRVSISTELPEKIENFPTDKEIENVRIKNRKTFVYRNWSFELTVITTVRNTVDFESYEMEVELLKPEQSFKRFHPTYVTHSLILKLIDMINMCECISSTSYLKHVETKHLKK